MVASLDHDSFFHYTYVKSEGTLARATRGGTKPNGENRKDRPKKTPMQELQTKGGMQKGPKERPYNPVSQEKQQLRDSLELKEARLKFRESSVSSNVWDKYPSW